MSDSFGKFVALVVAVFAVIIGGSLFAAGSYDEVTQERVESCTVKFISDVRQQGKITQQMYDTYIRDLDATGNIYNVELTYTKQVLTPGEVLGEVTNTSESFYTEDILAGVYNGADSGGAVIDGKADGKLCLTAGAYFGATVTNRENTFFQQVLNLAGVRSPGTPRIEVHTGGEIRDENW